MSKVLTILARLEEHKNCSIYFYKRQALRQMKCYWLTMYGFYLRISQNVISYQLTCDCLRVFENSS